MFFPQGEKMVKALPETLRVALYKSEMDSAGLLRAYSRTSLELLGLTWSDNLVEGF